GLPAAGDERLRDPGAGGGAAALCGADSPHRRRGPRGDPPGRRRGAALPRGDRAAGGGRIDRLLPADGGAARARARLPLDQRRRSIPNTRRICATAWRVKRTSEGVEAIGTNSPGWSGWVTRPWVEPEAITKPASSIRASSSRRVVGWRVPSPRRAEGPEAVSAVSGVRSNASGRTDRA